ncbi:MAG: PKD domain-containing protein, partial [Bacteroidota bacterium]
NLTGDAYHDGTEILRDTIIIPATFEDPSFTIFDPGDVTEGAQDGKYIELTVEEDTFNVATVSQDNIFLTDMPGGVSVDEVQFINKNTVRIYFAGNSFPDYDTPVDATVHILTEALVQHNSTYTIPYVFSAVNDAESISAKFRHSVGTNGAEATIDDEIIVINISGGHFLSSMINETNVSVTGNYTTAGISVDNIESAGADSFYIYLDHNGQDYDVDKELSVTVDVAAFTDSDAPVSTNITLPATNDPEDINLSWNFSPGTNGKEATLNNEVLHVEITGGTFIPDNLTGANIFLEGQAPSVGVSLDETKIYNKSLKSFNVEINWDSTDFDTDKTLVLQLSGDAYHDGTALLADTVMLDALNDQEVMNVSWAPDPGTNGLEASLDNEALIIAIYGGTFNTSEISLSNITLSGSAVSEAGVSASRVRAGTVTKTRFELELDWDGTDFDNNKELIVSLAMDAFEDPDSALIGSIILPATKEKVTTSGSIIDGSNLEANIKLGGETIVLSLSGTSWLPADGTDLTHANDYKSSTINTLFDGFYHVDGWDDLKEIVDALKADVTGGDNDAVIREDDYTLRITLPPVPNFEIDDGAIFSIIVPATLLEGTNGDVEITDPLAIMETASTTATIYGSKDICVGDSAMLTLVLGGSSPWRVVYSKDGIVHGEISNITDNVHEFWVAEPGIYKIDTVQDLYFTVGRPNVKIYGTAIINQNPLPDNVLISGLAPAYGVTTDPVTITSNGSPSGGVFTGEGVFYVSNDYKFYPGVAGVGNDLPIIYKYTDVNGCSNSDTASVNVIEAEGNITFNGKEESHFCYYDSLILIEGVGTDEDSTGVFDIEGTSRGLVEIGDEVYINPRELYDEGTSQKTFLLTYNYNSNTADLEWSETFIIEYIEPVRIITGLQTGEERRFCQDEPPVNLEGSKSEGIFSGPGIVRDPVDGFIFDPSAAPIGESTIQFSYSTLNCYSDTSVNVDVFQVPKPFFNIESRCIDGEFDSTQFVNITSPDSLVGEWEWNFGDGDVENPLANTSSLKNPKHFYQTAGTKTVMLTSRNKPLFNSCEADFSKTITLGEKPNPNFTWETVCFNNERPVQFKNPGSNQDIYKWHFPNLSGKDSVLTTKEPAIIFPELKEYSIKLVQTTNQFNCVDSVTKTIRFRPMYDVAVADYFENFEGDIIEWSQENEANSRNSWTLGKPDLSGLNGAASGDKAWYTLINRDEPENSWVSGPCFNFENAEKPMVSLDIWRSLSYNRDGAVLQYISNENADWTNVGAEEGINWFNSFQIIGNPGDQRNGWTSLTPVFSPDEDWVNASRWLDE